MGASRGIAVAKPASESGGGATVDAAALGEFTEQLTGRSGVLASAAYTVLAKLGLTEDETAPELAESVDSALAERVSAELGSCLLYTSPSPRDGLLSRMPSSA